MSAHFRRIAVLSAGVAVLAIEAMTPSAANAGGYVRTQGECRDFGGQPRWTQDKGAYWCETPDRDSYCTQTHPKYDKSGARIEFVYNVETGQCDELCFLTTTCVNHIGLDDDCFELSVLRRFRDDRLANMPGGRADIALYERNAPQIVARIRASGYAARELSRIYVRYILPSAFAARLGFDRMARRIYTSMMCELADRYGVAGT